MSRILMHLAVSCCVLFSGLSSAEEDQLSNSYQPLAVPVESGDRLVISGYKGSVKLVADPQAKQMTVKLKHVTSKGLPADLKETEDEWLFSLKRDEGKILAQVGSPVSKSVWAKFLAQPKFMPEFHLIVKGPSLPVVLSWQSGPIQIEGWQASMEMNLIDSKVSLSNSKGVMDLSQQTGALSVSSHEGPISVDTYDVAARFNGLKGDLIVKNFTGRTDVEKAEGKVEILSYSGQFEVNKGKGQINFESERGRIAVTGYEGDLNSETDIGSVRAVLVGKSRVKIKTRQGNVSLRMPNSGANVNVGTEKGYLNVPKHLRFTRLPNLRLMTGRLKGKNSGRVFVRTESGEIRLR